MKKINIHTKYLKTIADLLTPVGVYTRLRDIFPNALLLESADYHNRSDSKSFICLDPIGGFESKMNEYRIQYPGEEISTHVVHDPAQVYQAFMQYIHHL